MKTLSINICVLALFFMSAPLLMSLTPVILPVYPTDISWYEMEKAQKLASSEGKKVLVYAQASWCTYCNKMEKEVFIKQDVQQVISNYYYPVSIDIESHNVIDFNGEEMTEQEFSVSMKVSATPTFLFIDETGSVLGAQPGYIEADTFKALLTYVGSDAYSRVNFETFYENEYKSSQ